MISANKLLEKIEQCRHKMVVLTSQMPLTSDDVVTVSVQLDHLLNEYEKQRRNA